MAEVARERPTAALPAWMGRPLFPAVQRILAEEITWEMAAYAALVALAFTLRIWDVGGRAMHHDESLHATYAWYLFKGQGYHYNPLMHGPLQFYVMAFFYMLFGDSETTAKLFAVLCGTGLVLTPYFLRREIGRTGAILSALFLTISPTFLYFSRFARDDIYLDFFTLLIVAGMWMYFRDRRARYAYLVAVCAALAVCTMEASYIVIFILGSFVLLLVLRERITGSAARPVTSALRSVPVEVWLLAATLFVAITILLYSTFLSNPTGIWDPRFGLLSPNRQDILGGITYWLSQHGVARGGQPWFYYLLLLPLYEQFALIFGVAGVVWAFVRRDLFTSFLAYWCILSFVIYGWAGEKMPWLFMHPLLPTILLGCMLAGHLLTRLHGTGRAILIAGIIVLVLTEAHSAQALAYSDGANPTEMLIYVQTSNDVPLVANEVTNLVQRFPKSTARPLVQVDSNDLGGWPFEWYFRNMPASDVSYTTSFANASAPVLIMLGPEYDQYSAQLRRRYVVSQYRWNWWFPEDYKGLTIDNGRCGTPYHETTCPTGQRGMVFLKTGSPCPPSGVNSNCSPIQTPAAINIGDAATNGTTWLHLWHWFVFRTPFGARGARMLYLFVRKDLVPAGSGSFRSPPSLTSAPAGYPSLRYRLIRTLGTSSAQGSSLLDPRGITVGPNGDIYVADAGDHAVRVLNKRGRALRSFGTSGHGRGQFNVNESPMDVAVAGNGDIYVADWWGHRIEEFNSKGSFLRAWGHYAKGGPYGFYGPRSVAIGYHGDLYVADTGNRQIAVFSPSGRFLFRFGSAGTGSGQFLEPSSVVASPDGDIYVTDMWNGRVQRFDHRGNFLESWPVLWPADSYQEPYIAVLSNGNVAVTDPTNQRVLVYTARGKIVGQISDPALALPIGIASSANGEIYVTDATDNAVQVFAPGKPRSSPTGTRGKTRVPPP